MELYLSKTNQNYFGSNKRVMFQSDSKSNLSSPRLNSQKSSQLSSSGRMLGLVSSDVHNLGDIQQTIRLLQRGLKINQSSFSRQDRLDFDMKEIQDFQNKLKIDSQKRRLAEIQKELKLL